ncbi:MAG: DoxX family protein [Nitriliruptoraceae bacterium]
MDAADIALLILRLWLATVIIAHGINHLRALDGTASWFASIGFRRARIQARLSAVGEIAIGVGLALGLLTAFAAAGLIATMVIAFWSIHRFAGFFVFARPDEGYEYVATLSVAALVVAVIGPGQVSVDHALGLADRLDSGIGAAMAIAGVAAAAVQLALFWRRPRPEAGADPDGHDDTSGACSHQS